MEKTNYMTHTHPAKPKSLVFGPTEKRREGPYWQQVCDSVMGEGRGGGCGDRRQPPPPQASPGTAQHPGPHGSDSGDHFPEDSRPNPGASEYSVL